MPWLTLFGFFAVPIALLGAVVATIVFRGIRWRIAAVLPLVVVAAYFAVVLIPDWKRDPTSHNLFPFELGMYFWPTFPYMLILVALYRLRSGTGKRGGE
jgi:hypothetical protein